MNGKMILKLTKIRLKNICSNRLETAALLFEEIRKESKKASKNALLKRQEILAGKRGRDCAAGYARAAPSKPTVAVR